MRMPPGRTHCSRLAGMRAAVTAFAIALTALGETHGAVLACIAVTVGSFFGVQPLIDLARSAAGSLPF